MPITPHDVLMVAKGREREREGERERERSETKMIASLLKQDPNT